MGRQTKSIIGKFIKDSKVVYFQMSKTASKLLAQLEQYGLQAAPVARESVDNKMAVFISDNVGMYNACVLYYITLVSTTIIKV